MKREINGTVVIDASSEEEMYERLGIAHASDRGLQMLIMRILGKGRAAELLEGSDEMVEVDKFFRKLNWRNCTDELKKFDKRTNPQGKEYYWLTGEFINEDDGINTDEWALNNGYVSIVPVKFDMTDHNNIKRLNNWKF